MQEKKKAKGTCRRWQNEKDGLKTRQRKAKTQKRAKRINKASGRDARKTNKTRHAKPVAIWHTANKKRTRATKSGKTPFSTLNARVATHNSENINTTRPYCTRIIFRLFAYRAIIPLSPFGASDTTLTFQKFFTENFSLRIKIVI